MDWYADALNQTIVYWANPTKTGYGGATFDTPVEIDGRWEDRQDLFINQAGEEELSRAIVYLNQDVKVGEYLYLGNLDNIDSDQDPQTQTGAYRVKAILKSPDLSDSTKYVRKVWL